MENQVISSQNITYSIDSGFWSQLSTVKKKKIIN
jgi:hypothetical protein